MTIRGIPDTVLARLRKAAAKSRRSLNAEVLTILEAAAATSRVSAEGPSPGRPGIARSHRPRDDRTAPDYTGRVVLVTGAARGLGRAAAERFLERGASVALHVRDQRRADDAARSLADPARCMPISGDLEREEIPAQLVHQVLTHFGRLDVLVNNAALPYTTRFEQIPLEEWRRALAVNLTAPFLLTRAALPAMKRQGYGRIVNISSTAGRMVSTLGGAHYTTTKTGLLGLTRASAKELGKYGITVNAVCPGMIDTELTRESATQEELARYARGYPVPRLGTAREVADVICFAASEAAGYITGAVFDINGGDLMM